MSRNRLLAIIQAGGAGDRMDVLTRERAKPSLPFGGVFQLIDFPLSNLTHTGIDQVWLSVQYQASSLDSELANGRPWDLDRTHGGFRLLMPQVGVGPDEDGMASGNADVLFRVRDQIRAADAEAVIVLSADHIYRFDYDEAVRRHREKSAELTIVTTKVSRDEASHHATVVANRLGRVTGFVNKPASPRTCVVATEIFVYDPTVLIETLERLQARLTEGADHDETGLGDFGDHLIPLLVGRGRVYAYPLEGYWRDVGRPETYFAAHRDLLTGDLGVFGDPEWPVLTRTVQSLPARVRESAVVSQSLLSPGCDIRGEVCRSVLGPGVVVEAGAKVTDSIVFADTVVAVDARVSWSIVDTGVRVGPGADVGGHPSGALPTADELTLVGRDSVIAAASTVEAGARLEPGTTT